MLYNELIQYEAIESLIQLRDASDRDKAKNLVSTYVISEEMSERITRIIIPQLQFDSPKDNKGLLVVGNYGTGKSHLLSVISSICGDDSLLPYLTDDKVKEQAKAIAGKFKVVIRTELGSTTMPLRDILVAELEEHLKNNGINYSFPNIDKIISHKRAFEDMMQAFHEVFPDHGLILVVDELLDYLRSRVGQDLILDLNFMREIGEVCKDLRFRFIAGVQEAIFDSHKFMFVADSMRRVKDRFEQVRIARNDLKYVVAHRLLRKTVDQQNKIREYLMPYTKYYSGMNEKLEEFVNLFPIHPNYIDTFESISIIEKREVLKTISQNMRRIIDIEIPLDHPGLLAYDSYWTMLSDNPSYRTIPEIKEIIECNKVLTNKVEQAFTRPIYKPMALRIINGLSLHRLTTGDTHIPIGATPDELKNNLCLFDPNAVEMGGDEPDKDLSSLVETVLREIHKTVSGQFISANPENGQFYLDLKKVDDYDAIIEKRADTIGQDKLDTYYYEALKRVLERMDVSPYVSGYKIWQYELTWKEKNAPRSGYLFFGSPNERSTAVPRRDFYLYFLQPYRHQKVADNKLSDEIFLYLANRDEEFDLYIKLYAAAHDLSLSSSGQAKNAYLAKAESYLRKIVSWLQDNVGNAYELVYQGKRQKLYDWAKGKSIRELSVIGANETVNFRDLINTITSICLSHYFAEQAPEYPKFSVLITGYNRNQAVIDTLRAITGKFRSQQSIAVLDALELLDSQKINPANSLYAKKIMTLLSSKEKGQVLNRDEIISDELGLEYMDPNGCRLEPEWVIVILAAMVYSGDIVFCIPGQKFDAANISHFSSTDIKTILHFKHIELPKEWNIQALKALLGLLDLTPGLAQLITQGEDDPVRQLQASLEKLIRRIVIIQQQFRDGLLFWGLDLSRVFSLENADQELSTSKQFFESLQAFNTVGKLKNFNYSASEIETHQNALKILRIINIIKDFINNQNLLVTWLSNAQVAMPAEDPWIVEFHAGKDNVLELVKQAKTEEIRSLSSKVNLELQSIKRSYIKHYSALHSKIRLNKNEDDKKSALYNDFRLKCLIKLAEIDIMPKQQVTELLEKLSGLKSCFSLTENNLQNNPICPHCYFKPIVENTVSSASNLLQQIDLQIDKLLDNWTAMLLANLNDPHTQESIELLNETDKSKLHLIISKKQLPEILDNQFVSLLKQVLSGLTRVTISLADIQRAISHAGGSLSPQELRNVFEEYVNDLEKGKDSSKIRIVLE
jgi:succinate dehydrogenase flavin-adding protein (antitoxin of CptAB toxin-antitoxin module)